MIELKNVTKKYRSRAVVDDVSLLIQKGKCFGLLGPNGAGKTTIILMILGFIKPSYGQIHINGLDAWTERHKTHKLIGYIPEDPSYLGQQTGLENVKFMFEMRGAIGLSPKALLKLSGIERGYWDEKVKKYSAGMKQRLGIALAFTGAPDIVVLDEPFSNIDPIGRREIMDKMKDLLRAGLTVIISSHIIAELEHFIDSCAIIHRGKIVTTGSYLTLSQAYQHKLYEISWEGNPQESVEKLKEITNYISKNHNDLAEKTVFLEKKVYCVTKKPVLLQSKLRRIDENYALYPDSDTLQELYEGIIGDLLI